MGICRVPGCAKQREAFSNYCGHHKRRFRRHGHPTQTTISKTHLRPYVQHLKGWLDKRPPENGWEPFRMLLGHLVEGAEQEVGAFRRGGYAMPRPLRLAYEDVLKVTGQDGPGSDRAVLTVAAMYYLQQTDPAMFCSDRAFWTQLARRFRALTDLNCAVSWDQVTGSNKRRYRDSTPKHLMALGRLLARTLGALSLTVVATMGREQQERQTARAQAFAKVSELCNG